MASALGPRDIVARWQLRMGSTLDCVCSNLGQQDSIALFHFSLMPRHPLGIIDILNDVGGAALVRGGLNGLVVQNTVDKLVKFVRADLLLASDDLP